MALLPLPQRTPIPASAINSATSICVPLYLVPFKDKGGAPEYKLGINVVASNGIEKTAAQLYEFDTGGQGAWLYPNSGIKPPAVADCKLTITYTSGIIYHAVPTQLTLTFPDAEVVSSDLPPLSVDVTVGLIGQVDGPHTMPIYGHFWGDFGAALQGFTPSPSQIAPSLLTVLAQLPEPYNSGFIVDIDPYPSEPPAGKTPWGRVILGVTDELRTYFPNTVAMNPAAPYVSPQTQQPINTYTEPVINGDLQVTNNSPLTTGGSANDIGIVFDTGAPGTMLHQGTAVNFSAAVGDTLQLQPSATPIYSLLDFTVGNQPGLNAVGSASSDVLGIPAGYINTGIGAFFQYPILFDLTNKVVGFPSASS